MSARAVAAVRRWDARMTAEHGPEALWLACSHGDVIKAIVADALGLHLDQFQRIVADPASVTRRSATPRLRPFLVRLNDTGGDLAALVRRRKRRGAAARRTPTRPSAVAPADAPRAAPPRDRAARAHGRSAGAPRARSAVGCATPGRAG